MENIFSIWDEDEIEKLPFYGSASDLTTLTLFMVNCLKKLATSANQREMVLETWLAFDFTVRQFLAFNDPSWPEGDADYIVDCSQGHCLPDGCRGPVSGGIQA